MAENNDQNILITGASSGLGREIARGLIGRFAQESVQGGGVRLCLTGRRKARLEALQAELGAKIGTSTAGAEVCQMDMTEAEQMDGFIASLPQRGFSGLVLNAGITFTEDFTKGSGEIDEALVQTNITANLRLMRAQIELWQSRGQSGRILIIASLGGIVPLPYQAVYSGTKAFLVNFGLALREELRGTGIEVIIFAPGGIKTEMTDVAAMADLQNHLADPPRIAAAAIKAYYGQKALVIPGLQNKLSALAYRLLPRSFMVRQTGQIYHKARGQK